MVGVCACSQRPASSTSGRSRVCTARADRASAAPAARGSRRDGRSHRGRRLASRTHGCRRARRSARTRNRARRVADRRRAARERVSRTTTPSTVLHQVEGRADHVGVGAAARSVRAPEPARGPATRADRGTRRAAGTRAPCRARSATTACAAAGAATATMIAAFDAEHLVRVAGRDAFDADRHARAPDPASSIHAASRIGVDEVRARAQSCRQCGASAIIRARPRHPNTADLRPTDVDRTKQGDHHVARSFASCLVPRRSPTTQSASSLIVVAVVVGGTGDAVATGVVVGAVVLVVSMLTKYPLGVAKVLPFTVHSAGDYLAAALLIVVAVRARASPTPTAASRRSTSSPASRCSR